MLLAGVAVPPWGRLKYTAIEGAERPNLGPANLPESSSEQLGRWSVGLSPFLLRQV